MRSVKNSHSWQIRRLDQADVPQLLELISEVRREYGLATRVRSLLEPNDYAVLDVYRHRRSAYFVAVMDNDVLGGAVFFHWPTEIGVHANCSGCIFAHDTAAVGLAKAS